MTAHPSWYLMKAIQSSNVEKVTEILENSVDINAPMWNGETPLYYSVCNNYDTIVRLLLEKGAEVTSEAKRYTFHYALSCSTETVDALLRCYFATRTKSARDTRLDAVVENEYCEYVDELRLPDGKTLLHTVAGGNDLKTAELLLSFGASVNAMDNEGNFPVYYAIKHKSIGMAKLIWTDTKDTSKLLNIAVRGGSREVVEFILERVPDINVNEKDGLGYTPLHRTVHDELAYVWQADTIYSLGAEIAEVLLNHGARVDEKTENGDTALHLAVLGNYLGATKVLLENKADVNARQKNGMTALHIAVKNGNMAIMSLLVEHGAKTDARDDEGSTLLHLAPIIDYLEIVKMLLRDFGASVDAKDKLGKTALHIAAERGCLDLVKLLLDHGADVNVTCNNSKSPLDYVILRMETLNSSLGNFLYYHKYHTSNVAHPIYTHIVAMEALGLYVSKKNLRAISREVEHEFDLRNCQIEIENMRTRKVGDSDVSFYDVLTRGMDQLAFYARNKSIVKTIDAGYYRSEFPFYSAMIARRFEQGQIRESLLSSGLKAVGALCGYVLPDVPATELLNNLSNKDLENLIRAVPGVDLCDS